MRFTRRRAVSPIIATLLLIAIAVAAGIIVYVFVNSISGNLTQQGGQQVADQLSMDAYSAPTSGTTPCTAPCVYVVLRNVGSTTLTISQIYFDGNLCQTGGTTCTALPAVTNVGSCSSNANTPTTCAAGAYTPTTLTISAQTAGTSHLIRVVTSDGGTFTFSIIVGRSG